MPITFSDKVTQVFQALPQAQHQRLSAGLCGVMDDWRFLKSEKPHPFHEYCRIVCAEKAVQSPVVPHISGENRTLI